MTDLMDNDDLSLWWAMNLQGAADMDERFGATLLRIKDTEVPCLCLRQSEDNGTYKIIAPLSWGPIFKATEEDGIISHRHSDGVLDFWARREIMSPLRKWLEARGVQSIGS